MAVNWACECNQHANFHQAVDDHGFDDHGFDDHGFDDHGFDDGEFNVGTFKADLTRRSVIRPWLAQSL